MFFNSTCFGAFLNKLCAVISLEGIGNTEIFGQNIENGPEDSNRGFCTNSVRIPNLNCEDCEDTFGW